MRAISIGSLGLLLVALCASGCGSPQRVRSTGAFGTAYSPMVPQGDDWEDEWDDRDGPPSAAPDRGTDDSDGDGDEGFDPDEFLPDEGTRPVFTRPEGDIPSGMLGIPPFWFYWSGRNAQVIVPPLLSYYSDDLVIGFAGIINLSWRDREWKDDETGKIGIAIHDLNLLGLYRSSEYYYIEDGKLKRDWTSYVLWFIPLFGADGEEVDRGDSFLDE